MELNYMMKWNENIAAMDPTPAVKKREISEVMDQFTTAVTDLEAIVKLLENRLFAVLPRPVKVTDEKQEKEQEQGRTPLGQELLNKIGKLRWLNYCINTIIQDIEL